MGVTKITKTSGDVVDFSPEKLIQSIILAGADPQLAQQVEKNIEQAPQQIENTDQIHSYVYDYLKKDYAPVAARYDIRRAIINLGPTGFPFEQYTGAILQELGYQTELNQSIQGECVTHEVDVVAKKDNETFMIENKFHQRPGLKCSIQVVLYVKSRFDDVASNPNNKDRYGQFKQPWVITNTKFSKDATEYANCKGMKLTAWSYPENEGLGKIIDRLGLHPITALTSINADEKTNLIHQGIVLCKTLPQKRDVLFSMGMDQGRVDYIVKEAEAVYALRNQI